jgi:hypothetical protein
MAKKKDEQKPMVFVTGCNLSDGERFEAGETVPADIPESDKAALIEMNAIAEVGE